VNRVARAFSPGSVGNVGVGFDILGHPISGVGDVASVRRVEAPGVRIVAILGCAPDLPLDASRNTAGAALEALRAGLGLGFGFELEIEKGIALGSGMGGSASSCVAALVAANALLDAPLSRHELYPFAQAGESVASGGRNGDNIGPMLLGGLVLASPDRLTRVHVPAHWHCAVVHPRLQLETLRARAVLDQPYPLHLFVDQSAALAQLLLGCERGDASLVRAGLRDVLVEPRRAPLIPGFAAVKQAALDAGALGASISGAGPSVFAWCEDQSLARDAGMRMTEAFRLVGLEAHLHLTPINCPGAAVIE